MNLGYELKDCWADELFTKQEQHEIGTAIIEQLDNLPSNLRHDWKDTSLLLQKNFFIEASKSIKIPYIDKIIESESVEMKMINTISNG
jgi:hypothetical protein